MILFENSNFYIEKESSDLPWVKIFTKTPYKELTDIPAELRDELWEIYYLVEEEMRAYFSPTKINMASFANMLPRVHIHVIARFENDPYFPNPVWGEKLREMELQLPSFEEFYARVGKKMITFEMEKKEQERFPR